MIESKLRMGLQMSRGSFLPFVTRPVSAVFLAITLIIVVSTLVNQAKKRRAGKDVEGEVD